MSRKRQIRMNVFDVLKTPIPLNKLHGLWVILPAFLWLTTVQLRAQFLEPDCLTLKCNASEINRIDRITVGWASSEADALSTQMQNLAGTLAAVTPFALHFGRAFIGSITPMVALTSSLSDLSILLQTVAWNGTLNETARLLSNRPRPFVYQNPDYEGRDIQNYTSFYSGHVSFIVSSLIGLLLVLWANRISFSGLFVMSLFSQSIILTGAISRVLSGRHFISDVLIGALMGTISAIAIAWFNRRTAQVEQSS